jgi:hypothetical protein
MRKLNNGKWIIFLMSLSVLKCKEVYNPPSTKNNPDFLVVDGIVIAGNDSTIITLSRTKSLTDSAPTAKELEARVSVIDVSGVEFALMEQGEGRYVTSQLPLNATTSYQLKIITKDGNEFRSDPGKVNTSPPIDSVFWQQDSSGVQIYLNTHDPGNGADITNGNILKPGNFIRPLILSWNILMKIISFSVARKSDIQVLCHPALIGN